MDRKYFTSYNSVGIILRILVAIVLLQSLSAAEESCVGKPSGWKYQDPADCHGFFVCYIERAYQAYCDSGEKFDDVSKTCIKGKCPPYIGPKPNTSPCVAPCEDPCSTPAPCPTPTPTPTPTPCPTPTPTPAPCPTPTPTPTPCPTPTPTPTPCPTPTPTPCPTPTPTPTPCPTPTPTPTPCPSPTPTPAPCPTPTPTPTPCPTPTPTPTPCPTPTPTPTPCPTPVSKTELQTQPPTLPPDFQVTVPNGNVNPNIKQCLGLGNGSFVRDPVNCSVFYVCRGGEAVKQSCSIGQWFDEINFVCNFRLLVNCPSNQD